MYRSLVLAPALYLVFALAAPSYATSILTFPTAGADGSLINQAYGDNLAGTPNIVVSYPQSGEQWPAGFGDLTDVLTPNEAVSETILSVVFTADPSYQVQLLGFDMGGWNHADHDIPYLRVIVDGNTIYDASTFHVEGDSGHSDVDFVSLFGSTITITFDGGASAAVVGIDNITFDQQLVPTPEPTSVALLIIGGVGCMRMRRKRS